MVGAQLVPIAFTGLMVLVLASEDIGRATFALSDDLIGSVFVLFAIASTLGGAFAGARLAARIDPKREKQNRPTASKSAIH